ncbi:hypothetical protein [Clostridium thermarum]|uniref:hypothetical protein n=1 Tax=Clostridium thermarum TaxID=1716543 RepID=UPI00111F5460|nr:hypothetical protein [Clostridium thermarum]
MVHRSHVDIEKINKLPKGRAFEYKDVVQDDFPIDERAEDGKIFNSEVENGVFSNVIVSNERAHTTVKYKKI